MRVFCTLFRWFQGSLGGRQSVPGLAFMREGFGSLLCAFVKVKPVLWWRSQGAGVSRAMRYLPRRTLHKEWKQLKKERNLCSDNKPRGAESSKFLVTNVPDTRHGAAAFEAYPVVFHLLWCALSSLSPITPLWEGNVCSVPPYAWSK